MMIMLLIIIYPVNELGFAISFYLNNSYRLTLKLSCAMNFIIYPHDTQECKLQMESCE
jgi:hypothetical protein